MADVTDTSTPLCPNDCRDGLGEEPEVLFERPAVNVGKVQCDPPIKIGVSPCGNLPEAGDPGLHREPTPMPCVVSRNVVERMWPWPDQAHVAEQHVPELGELVDARLAEDPAQPAHPRVVRELEGGGATGHFVLLPEPVALGVRAGPHGPELG